MHPTLLYTNKIIVATCIIHQKKGTSVRITFLFLHIVSTSLKSCSPPMNEGMYTSVVELRLMSKPIQDSSFHFIVIAISVAPESFFHCTFFKSQYLFFYITIVQWFSNFLQCDAFKKACKTLRYTRQHPTV